MEARRAAPTILLLQQYLKTCAKVSYSGSVAPGRVEHDARGAVETLTRAWSTSSSMLHGRVAEADDHGRDSNGSPPHRMFKLEEPTVSGCAEVNSACHQQPGSSAHSSMGMRRLFNLLANTVCSSE